MPILKIPPRLFAAILLLAAWSAQAAESRIAVAASFTQPARALAAEFSRVTGHEIKMIFGSTGKLHAQIASGAPFDVFLAADRERPAMLEKAGRTVRGSRVTYAIGRLVLWSPTPGYVGESGRVLAGGDFRRLAIANPRHAPFGRAARQLLESMGLWAELAPRLVRGENVAQAFHFVATGNAELGLVSLSQIKGPGQQRKGSSWLAPRHLYRPIEQQAVLLRPSAAAREWLSFLGSRGARDIILAYGYELP